MVLDILCFLHHILVFYKIHEENKQVIVYAVVDQRQDYLNIIRGL